MQTHRLDTWIAANSIGPAATHALWLAGAAVVAYLLTEVLVARLGLPRPWFVLGHVAGSGGLVVAYFAWAGITRRELIGNWIPGLVGAVVASALLIRFVLGQPSSSSPAGVALGWMLLWLGVVYAVVDALLLTVMPVYATWRTARALGWRSSVWSTVAVGAIALAASLLVTAAYHWGFPEFRNLLLLQVLIGNGILTLAYLVTGSALAPVLGHIALHVTTILHAYSTALPLPPHY